MLGIRCLERPCRASTSSAVRESRDPGSLAPCRAFILVFAVSPDRSNLTSREDQSMLKWITAVAAVLVVTTASAHAQEVKVGVNLPYTGIGAEFAQLVD